MTTVLTAPAFVWGNVHNLATNRFHPILFRYAPPGSGRDRWKSVGHHTVGFDTRDEALTFIREDASNREGSSFCIEKDFPWDGGENPAMVITFSQPDAENNVVPLF